MSMPFMHSPSREGKKRRGGEASLSPRPSLGLPQRLPSIHHLLPDLPSPSTDHALAQLRSPLRQDPIGPTRSSTLPATLSPPPATRRPQVSAPGSRTNYQMDEREPGRNSYESSIAYQLPILDGPPSNHTTSAGRIPAPLYTTSGTDARRYAAALNDSRARSPDPGRYPRSGGSQSLPPHPSSYRSSINGTPLYSAGMNDRSPGSDDHSHEARSRISPTYPPLNNGYAPTPGYSLPPSAGGYSSMPSSYQQPYSPSSLHFEQEHMGGSQPRRRRGNLPRDTTDILKAWFSEHLSHPYPTEDEKQMLCSRTGLAMTQISNWFINARRRRIPELVNQAHAETRLRENSGSSSNSSERG